jgi:bifunctional UDP-N-acetylglucosamine pyrophosphorylase/glucosamine-1-phosphate N-acetyltransferase
MMSLSIVILAAGMGSRMRSTMPKVMHQLADKPLIQHVIDTASVLSPELMTVVCGNGSDIVVPYIEQQNILTVMQQEQLGTGHAVKQAIDQIKETTQTLVLYGDVPLISNEILQALLESGDESSVRVLTTRLDDPTGYGRIVRTDDGQLQKIVEQKDADLATQLIREVNTGIMALPTAWLASALNQLSNANAQGEYYLTDLVEIAVNAGVTVESVCCQDYMQVAGVNTRMQLAELERYYQAQYAEALMVQGVTLRDPSRIDIRGELQVGQDVEIDINVIFNGANQLGNHVVIGPNCVITNSVISDNAVILANSIIEDATVGNGCVIGPFARLRPGSQLADNAKVGNFVEIKNAVIGSGSKVNHLSYIGDTEMGRDVNIGAGTITCNYDGANKHKTIIGDRAFIGSDSQLVAPVVIEEGATIGAGSTIRKTAPADALTLTKTEVRTVSGWKRPTKKHK